MSHTFSWPRSMLLAGVVTVGITAAWFVAVIWLTTVAEHSAYNSGDAFEQLYVRLDGEPVIVTQGRAGVNQEVLSRDREPTAGNAYQVLHPNYLSLPADKSLVSSSDWT